MTTMETIMHRLGFRFLAVASAELRMVGDDAGAADIAASSAEVAPASAAADNVVNPAELAGVK